MVQLGFGGAPHQPASTTIVEWWLAPRKYHATITSAFRSAFGVPYCANAHAESLLVFMSESNKSLEGMLEGIQKGRMFGCGLGDRPQLLLDNEDDETDNEVALVDHGDLW